MSGQPTEVGMSIAGVNGGQRITGSFQLNPLVYLRGDPRADGGNLGSHVNPAALSVTAPGQVAPWPRTYLRNGGINNHDLSVFKNFSIAREGRVKLQIRCEMFNAFNHTQFSNLNLTTNVVTPAGATGAAVFNTADFSTLQITNNLRPAGSARPVGFYFGEYSAARTPRIIQLAAKFNF